MPTSFSHLLLLGMAYNPNISRITDFHIENCLYLNRHFFSGGDNFLASISLTDQFVSLTILTESLEALSNAETWWSATKSMRQVMSELAGSARRPGYRLEPLILRETIFSLGRRKIHCIMGHKQALMLWLSRNDDAHNDVDDSVVCKLCLSIKFTTNNYIYIYYCSF